MNFEVDVVEFLANPVSRRAWITFQLRLKGESFSTIARSMGVSRQAVRKALYMPYPRMEEAIASVIGLPPQVLFPERYSADGQSLHRPGRPKKQLSTITHLSGKANRKTTCED